MISFPNAKINLGLNIVSKREDGYHNLETVFYPIMIKDALEIIVSDKGYDSFIESGISTGTSPDFNLVMKALKLMREYNDIPFVEVHLLKKIPFGAGIGGGSADAAFMLKLLNEKFQLGITNDELAKIAAKLGADCPFFIYNRPLFAGGIGELFEEIGDFSLKGYHLVLIKPDIHVSTKDAFALIKPQKPAISLKDIIKKPVVEWKDYMVNDFESSIFPKYPVIQDIKERLYELGAIYASMSGSGSSVYGIFKEKTSLKKEFPDCYIWEEE
ncbi:MAG: 4-(cytidine 5'-diphospho)-2-C-methyl-D-erythritol kinase [Dysgonomonas sp.]|nr:4-(cytidine 5'-diphospho)-2-C-methyl-D-erythritol kinase [Dysgonomonas sp.]